MFAISCLLAGLLLHETKAVREENLLLITNAGRGAGQPSWVAKLLALFGTASRESRPTTAVMLSWLCR
jgi:hypothetical protein